MEKEHPSRTKALSDERFIIAMQHEIIRARNKFPRNENMALAAFEEAGETCRALLDRQQGKATSADVYKECVQAAIMFMRIATEGDNATGYVGYSFEDFKRMI